MIHRRQNATFISINNKHGVQIIWYTLFRDIRFTVLLWVFSSVSFYIIVQNTILKDNRKCKNPTIYNSIPVFIMNDTSINVKDPISCQKLHRQFAKTSVSTNNRLHCCVRVPMMKINRRIKLTVQTLTRRPDEGKESFYIPINYMTSTIQTL